MRLKRSLLVSLVFLVISIWVAVWLYARLPAQVPTHWSLQGQVNGHMPRYWAAAIWPLMIVVVAGLTWLLPVISPRRFEIRPFSQVYTLLMLAVQGLLLALGIATLLSGAGHAVPMPKLAMLGTSVLFMLIGNYMGKLRKNFFIGIRTPWTLASDAVWERTHRMAGWLFMLAGALGIVFILADVPMWLTIALMLAAAFIPALYSLMVYKRLSASD
ncbi:MAG: SdpI family protein [Rhodanobacter sp.]